jgi:hypothetical protein
MGLYCGIDLHSNNHVVTVIDETDRRLYEKRHANELAGTIDVLARFREELVGIAVESTFNWYWLVIRCGTASIPRDQIRRRPYSFQVSSACGDSSRAVRLPLLRI